MTPLSLLPLGELTELADDIHRLFGDLSRRLPHVQRAYSGECHPALDVLETDTGVEVVVDVAGVPADALRILFRAGVLVVAGDEQTFHLVERESGRFARAVRLHGAYDIDRSSATLRDRELTIVLPTLEERRGRPRLIPIAPLPPRPPAPDDGRP